MEEDQELRLLEQRKLAAMRKKFKESATPKAEKTDREVLAAVLYDRADEVLEAAYASYPQETERVVKELAKLLRDGGFAGKISGGELYSIFRQIGLRFQLKTTFKVQERGKFVDLSEKLKIRAEE